MKYEKGEIIELRCYQRICKPEHFMIKYQGFGISKSILDKLHQDNIKLIRFIYMGKNNLEIYLSSTEQFLKSNKINIFSKEDIQHFVSIKDMVKL